MKTKIKNQTKFTAVITCLCFMIGIFLPQSAIAAVPPDANAAVKQALFSVPSSAGSVTSAKYYGNDEIVINIQDLHCHAEVQKNISKILTFLDKKYGLDYVFLEGASGSLDTSVLSELVNSDMGRHTVETLLESGYLNGTEYYSVLNNKKDFVKGIEDERLYNRNIELLNNIIEVQPAVDVICEELLAEMKPVKRAYGGREVRKLDRLIMNFDKKRIKADNFYPKLMDLAYYYGLNPDNYKSVKAYSDFMKKAGKINNERVSQQFKIFFSELKSKITYKEFSDLSDKSEMFVNIGDISKELIEYSKKYSICEDKKLYHLKSFFSYLEFNNSVNPIEFTQEEKRLREDLYVKMGRSKYEQEVLFLAEFIPSIKGYFTANITAEELKAFGDNFKRFKKSWCSYFPENIAAKLDPYADMLSEYHGNNLKRDAVFADFIINNKKYQGARKSDGINALAEIERNLSRKNIKIVVTGGFHSKGLERIFNDNKVSHVVIMPKVTSDLEEAHDIYINTIKSYAAIIKNTINVKPFMGEAINESLPKLISSAFITLKRPDIAGRFAGSEKKEGLYEFVQEEFISKHTTGDLSVSGWDVESFSDEKMIVSVTYKNNADGSLEVRRYEFAGNAFNDITQGQANSTDTELNDSKPGSSLLSIGNNMFRDTRSAGYKVYTIVVAPILEEFVFRFVPFMVAGLFFANPVSAAAVAVTGLVGIVLFTLAHDIADKANALNPYAVKRDINQIFKASAAITVIFLIVAAIVPGMPLAAYGAGVFIHGLYNALVLSGKINFPVLSIFSLSDSQAQKAVDDNLNDIVADLEAVSDKYYGRFDWKLPEEMEKEYTAIVNELKKAGSLEGSDKYAAVSEQTNNILRFAFKEELKKDNNFYSSFLGDINRAFEKAGRYIKYDGSDEDESISDKLKDSVIDALITDSVRFLEGLSYRSDERKNKIIKDAAEEFSSIDNNTPAQKKINILLEHYGKLHELASESTHEYLHKILLPIAAFVNDQKTQRPLLFDYFKVFDDAKAENDRYEQSHPDDGQNISRHRSQLRSIMFDYFGLLYPFSHVAALEIVKRLHGYGYIDNKEEIPWSAKTAIENYAGLKEYYMAIADEGVDERFYGGLTGTLNMLKNITLSDDEAQQRKNVIVGELEFLSDKINKSTVALLEYQMREIIYLADDMAGKGDIQGNDVLSTFVSAGKSIVEEQGAFEKNTLESFESISKKLNYEDSSFDALMEFFAFTAANTDPKTDSNKKARELIYIKAKEIYDASVENDSSELKAKVFSVLQPVAEVLPHSKEISLNMFSDMGVNKETVGFFIEALRKSGLTGVSFVFPNVNEKIEYSSDIVDMLVDAMDIADMSYIIKSAYNSTENGKKISMELIEKLYSIAEEEANSAKMRETAAVSLAQTAAIFYSTLENNYTQEGILDIVRINNVFLELGTYSELAQPNSYMTAAATTSRTQRYSSFGSDDDYDNNRIFNYTRYIRNLPEEILPKKSTRVKNPVFLNVQGVTNRENAEVRSMITEFEKLQEVLQLNVLALEAVSTLSASSSVKDLDNVLVHIMKMAEALGEINKEHGGDALVAVQQIYIDAQENGINKDFIERQNVLGKWEEDKLEEIRGINTLINAIHQTSINDFKKQIKNLQDMKSGDVRTVTTTRDGAEREIKIVGYDLSDNKIINRDIKNFFMKLAEGRVSIDDFIFKEDIVVWTTRLFAHSVDIFFNFGDSDRGMSIYYHEAHRGIGNAERVKYFTAVLEKLGFKVDADTKTGNLPGTCGLKAVLNKDSGLNDATDLIDAASKAIMLFKHSTNLDMEIEEYKDRYAESSYIDAVFEPLVEKFMAGEIWNGYCYVSNGRTAFMDGMITKRINAPSFSSSKDTFNRILSYLGLPEIKDKKSGNLEQTQIDKYVNSEIERAFIEGRIVLNEKNELVPVQSYEIINPFVSSITIDNEELLTQSRSVNLVGKRKFNYRTLGFVGNYMFVSGIYKMSTGSLFVKGLMNPFTGRMKYTTTEFVTADERVELTNKELLDILNEDGYEISYEQELIEDRERKQMFKAMMSGLQVIESPEIVSTSTSDGNGTYVAGNITFDRENVGEGDILVVPYTTPDDIKAIETAKAIVTTGGGLLSHAAITTRELKKPSVIVSNSVLSENALDAGYYTQSGDIEVVNEAYVKKVTENRTQLKKGERILLNGETGSILLFNDIDTAILDDLQSIIWDDNVAELRRFIDEYKDSDSIGRLIEYVYFQTIGDKRLEGIMFALFDNNMPEVVKAKIKKLNEGYIREKVQAMEGALDTLETVDNVNIAYGILDKLINKLEFIRTTEEREDLRLLREKVEAKYVIKDKLFAFLDDAIDTAKGYLEKKNLQPGDIRRMVRMQHHASVFNYYVSDNETREDLLDKREELRELMSEVSNVILEYQRNYHVTGIENEIVSFNQIYYEDIYRFGSKTAELATMYRLLKGRVKVEVPMGVGVSTNVLDLYFEMIGKGAEFNSLTEDFENAVRRKDSRAAKEIAKNIQKLIDGSKILEGDAKEAKQKFIDRIKKILDSNVKYSVRSSGVGEDGENKAFAGMGETKLNVDYMHIFSNIEDCWKSFYSDRSIDYMIESGKIVKPAVLVQQMVNSAKSGVVFSRDKYGNTTIEAVYGLGEGLVSSLLTPDSLVVDAATGEVIEYSVAEKRSRIAAVESGTEVQIVKEGVNKRILSVSDIQYLMSIINVLESDSGYPVDVEFAIDADDRLFILQRRAITTLENTRKRSYVSEGEKTHNIALVAGTSADKDSIIVNIAHPDINVNEAVSVYYERSNGNTIKLAVGEQYSDLLENEDFLNELLDRLNNDEIVTRKLNSNLPVLSKASAGEIGIVPVFDDTVIVIDDSMMSIPYSSPDISKILSAA